MKLAVERFLAGIESEHVSEGRVRDRRPDRAMKIVGVVKGPAPRQVGERLKVVEIIGAERNRPHQLPAPTRSRRRRQ